jgi:hypothetical protein
MQRDVVGVAAKVVLAQRWPRVRRVRVRGEDPDRPNIIVGAKRFGGTNSRGPATDHDHAGCRHPGGIPAAVRSHTRCANGQCRGATSAVIAGVDIDHPEDDQR